MHYSTFTGNKAKIAHAYTPIDNVFHSLRFLRIYVRYPVRSQSFYTFDAVEKCGYLMVGPRKILTAPTVQSHFAISYFIVIEDLTRKSGQFGMHTVLSLEKMKGESNGINETLG